MTLKEAKVSSLQANYEGVFDGHIGFGKRAAVVVVDFVAAYTTEGAPLYAPDVVLAAKATVPLLEAARLAHVPVVYTRVVYGNDGRDGGTFVKKVPVLRSMTADNPLTEIVAELTPRGNDAILVKKYPSAFFGTPLAPMLTAQAIDTLIVVGCSTSGCVRATVVDGVSYGYRVIVPRECVGDRHEAPHAANLFDIQSKYGDVLATADVIAYFRALA